LYQKAIEAYKASIKVYVDIDDNNGIAAGLNNIGSIYVKQGDYANAINCYTKCLTIDEKLGDKRGKASSLNNIGVIYKNQGDYLGAIDYYNRSLKIRREIDNKGDIASSYGNIGNVYRGQGDSALVKNNKVYALNRFEIALGFHKQSLAIYEELDYQKGIARTLNNVANIYKEQGNLDTAFVMYNKCKKINKQLGQPLNLAISINNIGVIYRLRAKSQKENGQLSLSQSNYKKSIELSSKALAIVQKIGAATEIMQYHQNFMKFIKTLVILVNR
jgi:tetratricopeptide (TPR) repeat protein